MFQTHPTPEQKGGDQKAQQKILEALKNCSSTEKDVAIEEAYHIIGCILKEMVGPSFSEDFLVQMISVTSCIPKNRAREILEKSKKVYNKR